jgi:hypothetical protein
VTAALGFMFGVKTELQEGVLVLAGNQENVAAAASIAAARPATRDVFLATKGQATIAPIPGLDQDAGLIDER